MRADKNFFETFYHRYNDRAFVHPDPLETLYSYNEEGDMELIALIAALMAYGRVEQILKSLKIVFSIMGPEPALYLKEGGLEFFQREFASFKHRFAGADQLAGLLNGLRALILNHGSLRSAFALKDKGGDILPALQAFVDLILEHSLIDPGHLLPRPEKKSACKRLHLFLRWMVRRDAVDPGIWEDLGKERLLIPLDVHMHRIATYFGMTERKSGDIKTVREVTKAFAGLVPEDPVRYDFALTRSGILEKKKAEDFKDFFGPF